MSETQNKRRKWRAEKALCFDILFEICAFLTGKDILTLQLVCSHFRDAVSSDLIQSLYIPRMKRRLTRTEVDTETAIMNSIESYGYTAERVGEDTMYRITENYKNEEEQVKMNEVYDSFEYNAKEWWKRYARKSGLASLTTEFRNGKRTNYVTRFHVKMTPACQRSEGIELSESDYVFRFQRIVPVYGTARYEILVTEPLPSRLYDNEVAYIEVTRGNCEEIMGNILPLMRSSKGPAS